MDEITKESNLDKRITEAMHRIEELYNETDGKCYVSFSGGKDSTVLLALIKMCEDILTIPPNGIPAVFSNTGIELGVTVDFVKWCKENWYPNIQIIRPEVSFDWVMKNEGKPLKSKLKSEYIERWHNGNRSRSVYQNLIAGRSNSGGKIWKIKLADSDMHMIHDDFPIKVSKKCCDYLKKKPFKEYPSYFSLCLPLKTNVLLTPFEPSKNDTSPDRISKIATLSFFITLSTCKHFIEK